MPSSAVTVLRLSQTDLADTRVARSQRVPLPDWFMRLSRVNRPTNSKQRFRGELGDPGSCGRPAWARGHGHHDLPAAGLLEDGHLALVNVGDSRAYLWRERTLTQLTRDHSVTAELVQRGELREADASRHPHYGVLTRALGVALDVKIDCRTLTLEQGDRLVVCSDGLFNEVSSFEIAGVMAEGEDVAGVADRLVGQAISRAVATTSPLWSPRWLPEDVTAAYRGRSSSSPVY